MHDEFLCILKYFLHSYYFTDLTKYLEVCSILKHTLKKKKKVTQTDCNFSSSVFSTTTSGQYDGRGKPLPEYHAKISGFDERVCF